MAFIGWQAAGIGGLDGAAFILIKIIALAQKL